MGGVARSSSMKPLVIKINRLNGNRWKVYKIRKGKIVVFTFYDTP